MEQENDSEEIQQSGKRIAITEYFEKLFARKDQSASKTITRSTWFLKDDMQFQENAVTPVNEMYMYNILRKLNGKNEDELRKINVEISSFIEEVVNTLLSTEEDLKRINKTIETWNITKNYSCLPDAIKLLNGQMREKCTLVSNLTVSISRMDYFPAGSFDFCFVYSSRLPHDPATGKNSQAFIKSRKPISTIQERDVIMFKTQDWSNTFDPIQFSALDLSKDQSYVEKEIYSGSTLAEFWITVNKSGEAFGRSSSQPFFRSLLSKISDLRTVSTDLITSKIEIPIEENNKQKIVSNIIPGLALQMTYEFDPLTRASILSKIHSLFESVIRKRAEMQNIINEILDRYFPEISEQVKNILNRSEEGKGDRCDCSCMII